MGDLQCPATLLVLGPDAGDRGATGLTDDGGHVRLVYACPSTRARALALAADLDAGLRDEPHLEASTPERLERVLGEIADLHRGESVAVLPAVAPARCAPDGLTVVRVDADGTSRDILS